MKKGGLRHSKEFEGKGYELSRFTNDDTRRIGNDEIYKYYAAKDGMLKEKFTDLVEAAKWIEFR